MHSQHVCRRIYATHCAVLPCAVPPCPAGADFLTVLGAHEGEGLLVEHDAAVSDSAGEFVQGGGIRGWAGAIGMLGNWLAGKRWNQP